MTWQVFYSTWIDIVNSADIESVIPVAMNLFSSWLTVAEQFLPQIITFSAVMWIIYFVFHFLRMAKRNTHSTNINVKGWEISRVFSKPAVYNMNSWRMEEMSDESLRAMYIKESKRERATWYFKSHHIS